ncbi:helix-turn-helix transcriptional regulator [Nocardiopsis sp. CNT-189]|uniref:helix-turn-helix domain-containing protein n=1 Tax=Nocardiopsis oceanisediminis TaxID=2816862 RepID=UPI003B36BA46
MENRGKPGWRKLGSQITVLRKKARLYQRQVAAQMNVVPAHVSAWENGKRGMSEEQVTKLDRLLNGNGRLVRAWEAANTPESLPSWYEQVPELERGVSELREYQCQIIPGLIQTADYAKVTIEDSTPWKSPAEVKRMVESRMERQEILHREHPPLVSIVVEAFVLGRIVGDERIQAGQLDSVLTLIEEGRIRFQATPPAARRHPGTAGPFRVYTFPDNPPLASAEYSGGEVLMEKLQDVQRRMTIFGNLQAEALSQEATVKLIRKIRKEIDERERP